MAENGFTRGGSGDEKLLKTNVSEKSDGENRDDDSIIEVVEPSKGSWGRAW